MVLQYLMVAAYFLLVLAALGILAVTAYELMQDSKPFDSKYNNDL